MSTPSNIDDGFTACLFCTGPLPPLLISTDVFLLTDDGGVTIPSEKATAPAEACRSARWRRRAATAARCSASDLAAALSSATLTTVGYGDIVPANNSERTYALFSLLIGALVFGYMLSMIGEVRLLAIFGDW